MSGVGSEIDYIVPRESSNTFKTFFNVLEIEKKFAILYHLPPPPPPPHTHTHIPLTFTMSGGGVWKWLHPFLWEYQHLQDPSYMYSMS